jgi:hypothetical protein
VTRARATELVLWPVAAGLLVFAALKTPRGEVASSAGKGTREAVVSAAPQASSQASDDVPGAAPLPAQPVEPRRIAALFAPAPRQATAAADAVAPEPAPPQPLPEAAPWLRFLGSVVYGGSTVHYFNDQRTGALLRVPAEGEGEWTVEAREAGGWILRRGEALYRVKGP